MARFDSANKRFVVDGGVSGRLTALSFYTALCVLIETPRQMK
jgi:hypothetical protein